MSLYPWTGNGRGTSEVLVVTGEYNYFILIVINDLIGSNLSPRSSGCLDGFET